MYVYRNLHCILLLLFILISMICGGKLTFGTLDDIKASLDKERDDFNPLKSPEFVKVNYYFPSSSFTTFVHKIRSWTSHIKANCHQDGNWIRTADCLFYKSIMSCNKKCNFLTGRIKVEETHICVWIYPIRTVLVGQ